MTTNGEKPHFSSSQINMITVCGEQYRRRYIEGEIIPPGVAIIKGKATHKGAETNMRQKIESGVDLSANEIVDAAVAAFEGELHGAYLLTKEEQDRGAKIVLGEAKDEVVSMAKVHAEQQAPDYQPMMVEQTVRIELPGKRDLLGVIDLADDQHRIVDFKTSKRKKSQNEADESIQLTVYAAAYQGITGTPPSEVRLDTLVNTKSRGTERQVLTSNRSRADIVALANRINAVSQAVESGAFVPAAMGIWQCSEKFCGYWRSCPYVNSERSAAAAAAE